MKPIIHKIALMSFSLLALLSTSSLLQSCKDEDEAMKWVDLRYDAEDAYLRTAKDPEPISFRVKSTDPWEVFGKYDWYTISPDKGEAGEIYTVTITCKENTALDDRIDTINIKSDYWTGKKFVLTQKGTAYLTIDGLELIEKVGGEETFDVLSNQKWTAKVTEGSSWLTLKSGASGELNGKITVEAHQNTGEQRTGIVTIYNRHGEIAQEVSVIQNGVLLNPETPENGKWYAIYEAAQKLTIHIESNGDWTVSKENEEEDDWYTFEQTSFSGSADLAINVNANAGSNVRTGTVVLTSKADEGATPVKKTFKFKQANPQRPEILVENKTVSGDYYGPKGLMPGRYNFHLQPLNDTKLYLYFIWSGSTPYAELRFHIPNKKLDLSTTPWCGDVYSEKYMNTPVDTSKPHVMSFEIQKAIDKNDPEKAWIYSEWILDGAVIGKATSDGWKDSDGTSDLWKVPFDQISSGGTYLVKAQSGSAVFTKIEYIAPLVWGD